MPRQDPNHVHHKDTADHYENAARHHELAAKSYREAARMRVAGNHDAAAAYAITAHGHTLHALHHSEEAIKEHANIQASVQRP